VTKEGQCDAILRSPS